MPPVKRAAKVIGKPISKRSKTGKSEEKKPDPPIKTEEALSASGDLRTRFLKAFELSQYQAGIPNSDLQKLFPNEIEEVAKIINELSQESRLVMAQTKNGLLYTLLGEAEASKFHNLDSYAKLVYSVIEKAGRNGIWTRDIRIETNLQTSQLTKILKQLEGRQLIKPVKSVNAKAKKLYMLYDLTPSTELTGGIWYSDMEFDHEFIYELRGFLVATAERKNGGSGLTTKEFHDFIVKAKVSRVSLGMEEVQQLIDTLVFDYRLEKVETKTNEIAYRPAPKIKNLCNFGLWDVLDSDFHFRAIRFEDNVTLSAHEPHYHTR